MFNVDCKRICSKRCGPKITGFQSTPLPSPTKLHSQTVLIQIGTGRNLFENSKEAQGKPDDLVQMKCATALRISCFISVFRFGGEWAVLGSIPARQVCAQYLVLDHLVSTCTILSFIFNRVVCIFLVSSFPMTAVCACNKYYFLGSVKCIEGKLDLIYFCAWQSCSPGLMLAAMLSTSHDFGNKRVPNKEL